MNMTGKQKPNRRIEKQESKEDAALTSLRERSSCRIKSSFNLTEQTDHGIKSYLQCFPRGHNGSEFPKFHVTQDLGFSIKH